MPPPTNEGTRVSCHFVPPHGYNRTLLMNTVLPLTMALLIAALGCTATEHRAPRGPLGCCCTYTRCAAEYLQPDCASVAQYEGWTYTWHQGACNASDHAPAPDVAPR